MQFTAIVPIICPRCNEGAGTPVAFATGEEIDGYVARLVCPACGLLWDDLCAVADTSGTFEDDFIGPDKEAFALRVLPFSRFIGMRDFVPKLHSPEDEESGGEVE